jgi:predicted transposase YbfD/YdcC
MLRRESFEQFTEVDKGHGRIEKRTLTTTTWLTDYLASDWENCLQVFQIRRERRIGSKVEVEVVYGITSLSRDQADAERLLRLNRDHWGIENGLHYRRDVTLCEDASRIRKGGAGQVMAILRNIIIYLLPRSGQKSLPAAIRHYMFHPEKTLEIMSSRI